MCTVTYIGTENQNFILTSNRDVPAARSSPEIMENEQTGQQLIYPKDAQAGGTWIAMSSTGRVVCLLNGAFIKHPLKLNYRKSRGLLVLESFDYPDAEAFFQDYNFEGIEPFTFLIFDKNRFWEMRWDEQRTHIKELDIAGKYMWSSAPLYDAAARKRREAWFDRWLNDTPSFTQDNIIDFHLNGGEKDDWNGFIMNRFNIVQTVSNTSIQKDASGFQMRFHDFVSDKKQNTALAII